MLAFYRKNRLSQLVSNEILIWKRGKHSRDACAITLRRSPCVCVYVCAGLLRSATARDKEQSPLRWGERVIGAEGKQWRGVGQPAQCERAQNNIKRNPKAGINAESDAQTMARTRSIWARLMTQMNQMRRARASRTNLHQFLR